MSRVPMRPRWPPPRTTSRPRRRTCRGASLAALVTSGLLAAGCSVGDGGTRWLPALGPSALTEPPTPDAAATRPPTALATPTERPVLLPAPSPTPAPTAEPLELRAPPPLTAEAALALFVEQAPLPAEARLIARTLRPTFTAEYEPAGYWLVHAGPLGEWRVWDHSWAIEPADGTAELWELQHRWELR